MRHTLILTLTLTLAAVSATAQVGGNAVYGQGSGSARAEQTERNKRVLSKEEIPPGPGSTFIEASVLINVKADECVAVFGMAEEAKTVEECGRKMDATIARFTNDLKSLGVRPADLYVDFVAQNRTYEFEVNGDIAREKLSGFELKKNVSVHYKDKTLLDRLLVAASKANIFDLIKVDYVVANPKPIQNRLMEEASRIVKQKAERFEKLLGLKLHGPAQVYAERPSVYYPSEMYDSYQAFETEDVNSGYYRQKFVTQGARKSRTFYFNALNGKGFDTVINPVVIEPVVQFTLYLKVRYDGTSTVNAPRAASNAHK